MRKTGLVILAIILSIGLYVHMAAADQTTIAIKGIKCENCVQNIKTALDQIDGVKEAKVCMKSSKATVVFDAEKTDEKKLEKAIAKAGYHAGNTLSKNTHNCKDDNCPGKKPCCVKSAAKTKSKSCCDK